MNADVATDRPRLGPQLRSLYTGTLCSDHVRMRRGLLLICFLAVVAFLVTLAWVRLLSGRSAPGEPAAVSAVPVSAKGHEDAAKEGPGTIHGVIRNAAVQKSGPPDPRAQASAVTSAQSAADAAARIAAGGAH